VTLVINEKIKFVCNKHTTRSPVSLHHIVTVGGPW